jgi:hypothetical protein
MGGPHLTTPCWSQGRSVTIPGRNRGVAWINMAGMDKIEHSYPTGPATEKLIHAARLAFAKSQG